MDNNTNCGFKNGSLPDCAPLAMSYTPVQERVKPVYDSAEALSRGTLFPGLDLPFMNMVNSGDLSGTPLGELMALDFVTHELGLYLDTHADDKEAFELFQELGKLAKTAHEKYAKLYGPINKTDLLTAQSYSWLKNPWPWEYMGRKES